MIVDYMHAPLPIVSFRGKTSGKRILIMSGVHGIELAAMHILYAYMQKFSQRDILCGEVKFAPIVNTSAFKNATREARDGKDLNRTFPGAEKGSPSEVLSHAIMTQLVAESDIIIDLHSGTENVRHTPHVRVNRKYLELAKIFGTPIIYLRKASTGMLAWAADKYHSVPVITVEVGGGHSALHQYDSLIYHGIDNILIHNGIINGNLVHPQRQFVYPKRWRTHISSPQDGITRLRVNLGARVDRGDTLGTVYNPLKLREVELKAAHRSIVFSVNLNNRVRKGERVLSLLQTSSNALSFDYLRPPRF